MLRVISCIFGVCALLCSLTAQAHAAYPERPVTVIVGFGAGGATDIMGRAFAELLGKELGATFIIKNVAGAGGTIGTAELAKADPDGYTLGYLPVATMSSQPNLRKLPYKWNAFTPICLVTNNPVVLVTHAKAPWKTFQEAVEHLKQNPGKYFFTSSSPGSSPHISQQALFAALGLKVNHMPSKDSGSAIQALNSGTVQFYADPPVIIRQFGLVGLAVFGDKKLPEYPDLPTMKELGINVPAFTGWHGFWGPANLPADVLSRLEEAAAKVIASEEFRQLCARTDMQASYLNSAEFTKFFESEYALYSKYAKEFGLKK